MQEALESFKKEYMIKWSSFSDQFVILKPFVASFKLKLRPPADDLPDYITIFAKVKTNGSLRFLSENKYRKIIRGEERKKILEQIHGGIEIDEDTPGYILY